MVSIEIVKYNPASVLSEIHYSAEQPKGVPGSKAVNAPTHVVYE
jgi:hypothetical protein